ncbi:hypothetical protein LC065_20040 (plasmid) [Halobacillus litoralis]|uniref:hypothetical protein n=1 Tax=Halobacillus litoralis TaxID=45668 RepID=UPI001CFC9628|nr:hypothetical protein [Halobacillus litoralis]WLR49599.1 hypothetical protein LC065_20040 [Halobacillus litoralis]
MAVLEQLNIQELLDYGLGTAMTVVLVVAMIYFMNKLVNGLGSMVREQGVTLKEVADTLSSVQAEIKELRSGQQNLWQAVRNLESGKGWFNKDEGGQDNGKD